MVMLLEGRHLQFFVHKKLDPSSLYKVMEIVALKIHRWRQSIVKTVDSYLRL